MRYFFSENTSLPLRVNGKIYRWEITARVAGTNQGVLTITDEAEADKFVEEAVPKYATEISEEQYNEVQAKKKQRVPFNPLAGSAPTEESKPSAPPVVAEKPEPAITVAPTPDATISGQAAAEVVPAGNSETIEEETLPDADDVFDVGQVEKPTAKARKPKQAE